MFQSRFWYVALVLNGLTTRLIAPLLATLFRGRIPLPFLREVCASLFFSPSTVQSGIKKNKRVRRLETVCLSNFERNHRSSSLCWNTVQEMIRRKRTAFVHGPRLPLQ